MDINELILKKINKYFLKISLESHKNILNNIGYEYIPTEPDYLYDSLEIIKNNGFNLKDRKFLDVGSGVGNMCYIASLFEMDCEGIELNPVLFKISEQIYPEIKFYNIDIQDFNDYQKL